MACHDLERSLHVTFSVLLREIRLTLQCAEFPFLMQSEMLHIHVASSFPLRVRTVVSRALCRDLHASTTQWRLVFTTVFEMIYIYIYIYIFFFRYFLGRILSKRLPSTSGMYSQIHLAATSK